jgi:hypothetical protein
VGGGVEVAPPDGDGDEDTDGELIVTMPDAGPCGRAAVCFVVGPAPSVPAEDGVDPFQPAGQRLGTPAFDADDVPGALLRRELRLLALVVHRHERGAEFHDRHVVSPAHRAYEERADGSGRAPERRDR